MTINTPKKNDIIILNQLFKRHYSSLFINFILNLNAQIYRFSNSHVESFFNNIKYCYQKKIQFKSINHFSTLGSTEFPQNGLGAK